MNPGDPEDRPLRLGLLGYGLAGKTFHAPLIGGVPGLELAAVSSSKPASVRADWPDVPVLETPGQMFDDPSIDVVVVASANDSHHALAKAALLAGKHVVVDKPCTVTLAETEDLLATAHEHGRVLTVFQNRRFDADFLALKSVLASGRLGRIVHMESHYDRYRPQVLDRWRDRDAPGAGLWVDLGAHLVDQALQLWGCPDALLVEMTMQRDGSLANDWFHAVLRYDRPQGLRVVLHASALVPALGPRFAVHGSLGSFVKFGLDRQEDALKAGQRPQLNSLTGWGIDPQVGELTIQEEVEGGFRAVNARAPSPPGNYLAYYANLRDHLWGRGPIEVTPQQVRQAMAMLSRGEQSAREGRWIATGDLRQG